MDSFFLDTVSGQLVTIHFVIVHLATSYFGIIQHVSEHSVIGHLVPGHFVFAKLVTTHFVIRHLCDETTVVYP